MSTRVFESLTPQQQLHKDKLIAALNEYLPEQALSLCAELIMFHRLHLHIEVERKGRYGDYTPHSGKGSRISINHILSPFEFFNNLLFMSWHTTRLLLNMAIITIRMVPNGKMSSRKCMRPFFELEMFPYDLKATLAKHMQNPKYSQSADVKLLQVLRKYDSRKKDVLTLSQLPDGAVFRMKADATWMRRINKLRTYILCESLDGRYKYRVHTMVEVVEKDA